MFIFILFSALHFSTSLLIVLQCSVFYFIIISFPLTLFLLSFECNVVRIKGTVVALLRGGGCSFGIKVINAQKLGAVAVIVVNTDESKTMRIMASNDEVPLINIPCIMVSRRLQSYLEDKLTKYYLSNQHFISFDPTGMFGEYESKSISTQQQRH